MVGDLLSPGGISSLIDASWRLLTPPPSAWRQRPDTDAPHPPQERNQHLLRLTGRSQPGGKLVSDKWPEAVCTSLVMIFHSAHFHKISRRPYLCRGPVIMMMIYKQIQSWKWPLLVSNGSATEPAKERIRSPSISCGPGSYLHVNVPPIRLLITQPAYIFSISTGRTCESHLDFRIRGFKANEGKIPVEAAGAHERSKGI